HSAAAAALCDLSDAGVDALLGKAIDHTDPRVRANAIEALDRLVRRGGVGGENGRRFVEFKVAGEHRARANALRALSWRGDGLLDLGPTWDDLTLMLTDDRSPHRLAGVWLSERLLCGSVDRGDRWRALARHVASLARDEADAHIKARAVRCSRRLLGELARPAHAPSRFDPALGPAKVRLTRYAAAHAGGER
ncbi:MAG: hypothetical protein K8E66_01130, partial [Phycisphaerales bacterium]|nr:hypothetical protein [Phycisphaerales bacterium]